MTKRSLAAALTAGLATLAIAPTAQAAWVDAKTILTLEAEARPAPYPVRALSVQTVKHLRAAGFPVSRPSVRYARSPLGGVQAYVRRPSEIVVLPRAQRDLTALARCVRARAACSTKHVDAASTLVHETLHTMHADLPGLRALEDYQHATYAEGLTEAVTGDLMAGWYVKVAKRRAAPYRPATYIGESFMIQEETARACGDRRKRNSYCARRSRADLLRADPSEWVRVLERR